MSGGYPIYPEVCNANDQGTDTANSRGTGLPTFNTWTQLVASTPSDTAFIVVQFTYGLSNNWIAIIDIGIGGSGSEVVLIPSLATYTNDTWIFPVNLPAGTRIAARVTYDQSAVVTVNVILLDSSYLGEGNAGVDTVGFDSANHGGTSVSPSASANTKGSFTQLVASTAVDYAGFYVEFSTGDTNPGGATGKFSLTDIAIGSAGNEVVIVPNIQWQRGVATAAPPQSYYPMPIPAGTRISARCATDAATGTPNRVMLYGVYK